MNFLNYIIYYDGILLFSDVPGAPGIPKKIEPSEEGAISIGWTKPRHDGGAPITGYVVEKRLIHEEKWTKATHAHVPDLNLK